MTRHNPPCDDPACDPCWWDAVDRETHSHQPPPVSRWVELRDRITYSRPACLLYRLVTGRDRV